ncbi:DUF2207 domain-containing protein [Deferribacter autotrophicus]|uniref:DUF2207 domain-containing protein n=1 Tax=Deferribacter autotrophicus TaxID=500465 RepID=A0A5A8F1S3_9BACT|nr:DUF2207 domain-containing protein [Deferribacter autotrophicus]KAA0257342.1 DUF2207 domain-containing protein [Deferribacter autotrophicus]
MKRLLIFFVISLLFAFSSIAKAEYFYIKDYVVNIFINKNSVIDVEEKILVHFNSPRHGIFRKIPYKYHVENKDDDLNRPFIYGSTYKIKIYDVEVDNFNFTTYKKGNYFFIKIGSANKFVSGDVRYIIRYKIYGAINFFDDHSEFYFNVIGQEWPVPIEKASFNIQFPDNYKPAEEKYFIVTGRYGERKKDISYLVREGLITGETNRTLPPKNGITVGIWFPPNVISKGSFFSRLSFIILNNKIYLLPLVVFIVMFILWYLFGRDKNIIRIVQYKLPENITPAEAGVLIDDKTDNRDLISLIFYWAANGYLEIEETEDNGLILKKKDYILNKLKDLPENAKSFEKTIFYGLFPGSTKSVRVSTLKDQFYIYMNDAREQLNSEMTLQDYYESSSQTLTTISYFAAVVMFFIGIGSGVLFQRMDYLIALIISALITFIFARIMPKKTDKGAKVYQLVDGFREFIERVEKPKLKVLLKQDPNYFDKILSYAVALGIEDKVAEKFKDLITEPPKWYRSTSHRRFSTVYFVHSLNDSMKVMNTAFTSSPQSSSSGSGFSGGGGGGFSGGGFGGGGGGSW